MPSHSPVPALASRAIRLVVGCIVLGIGVALLLTADLGSDGYSSLINGITIATGAPFTLINMAVAVGFLLMASVRGVKPGIGTLAQVVIVSVTIPMAMAVMTTPAAVWGQVLMLAVAFPVLATGIATYLGCHVGAGPSEAAALAWDPPFPFKWSYNLVQLVCAVVGWWCGATIGFGTIAVIALLGPGVSAAAWVLRVDVHQAPVHKPGSARG